MLDFPWKSDWSADAFVGKVVHLLTSYPHATLHMLSILSSKTDTLISFISQKFYLGPPLQIPFSNLTFHYFCLIIFIRMPLSYILFSPLGKYFPIKFFLSVKTKVKCLLWEIFLGHPCTESFLSSSVSLQIITLTSRASIIVITWSLMFVISVRLCKL
jgi:hypothetical protein